METKKGEMTLDKLAEITQQGFKDVREEFKNEIDKLAEMTQREFGVMEERFKEVDRKFGMVIKESELTKNEVRELRAETDERFKSVLDGQDKDAEWREDSRTENAMGAASNRRHQDELEKHRERIEVIEKKLEIAGAGC